MNRVTEKVAKYESIVDSTDTGEVYLSRHVPPLLEPAILRDVCGIDWQEELQRLRLDKRFFVAGDVNCTLSKEQMQALCLVLLAHSQTCQASVESFDASNSANLSVPLRIRMAAVCLGERYLGPSLSSTDGLIRSEENSGVADTYCGMSELYHLDNTEVRKGFFLGDGGGIGKRKIFAALVAEYSARGVWNCVYLCRSSNEFCNVNRELKAMLNTHVKCYKGDDLKTLCNTPRTNIPQAGKSERIGKNSCNVLFLTYKDLADLEKFFNLQKWLGAYGGFDGLVWFSSIECALASKRMDDWQTCGAERVLQLQSMYPNARVVYSSEGISQFKDVMGLCSRLGLWNKSLPIKTRIEFCTMLEKSGNVGLNQTLMELKMDGTLVSRHLSLNGVKTIVHDVEMHNEFRIIYNRCCQLWMLMYKRLCSMLEFIQTWPEAEKAKIQAAANQLVANFIKNYTEFFEMMVITSKLSQAQTVTRKCLLENKSVVLFLKRTGSKMYSKFRNDKNFTEMSMPFSATMFLLRETMISLGVPVGCPKAYLKNGEILRLGKWTDVYESKLEQAQTAASNNWFNWSSLPLKYGGTFSQMTESTDKELGAWLRYSFGSTMDHARFTTPRAFAWTFSKWNGLPRTEVLARLYHELSVFLPINNLDEMMDRLNCVQETFETTRSDKTCGASEISDRELTYEWSYKTEKWNEYRKTPFEQSYKKFQDGLNRVVVVAGEKEGIGLELHADKSMTKNVGQRVLIFLDFSFSLEDLMNQIGLVHRSGQEIEPEVHALGNGCFPGDQVRMVELVNRLKELGATAIAADEASQDDQHQQEQEQQPKILDLEFGNGVYTAAGLHVILKVMDNLLKTNGEIGDWLKIVGNGFKMSPHEEPIDMKQITASSQAAASAFLSRCLRLPFEIQKLVLNGICHGLRARMDDFEPCGIFIAIPSTYLVNVEKKYEASSCSVQLVSVSRCAPFEEVMQLETNGNLSGMFLMEKESRGICYSFLDNVGQRFAIYPFCSVPQIVNADWLSTCCESVRDIETAKSLWTNEYDLSFNKRRYCGHNRLLKIEGACARTPTIGKCTHQWGCTKFVILEGHCGRAGLFEGLEKLKVKLSLLQHCRVKMEDGTVVVGVYVGNENAKVQSSAVYKSLLNALQNV